MPEQRTLFFQSAALTSSQYTLAKSQSMSFYRVSNTSEQMENIIKVVNKYRSDLVTDNEFQMATAAAVTTTTQ